MPVSANFGSMFHLAEIVLSPFMHRRKQPQLGPLYANIVFTHPLLSHDSLTVIPTQLLSENTVILFPYYHPSSLHHAISIWLAVGTSWRSDTMGPSFLREGVNVQALQLCSPGHPQASMPTAHYPHACMCMYACKWDV